MQKSFETVGVYVLEELVASGPNGDVYRARDSRLGRYAAVRIMAPDLVDTPLLRARLNREASVLAQLDHPNVPPLYDAEEVGGTIMIASRWVDGTPLDALVAKQEPFDASRAVRIVTQVAWALHTAHRMGLIHRGVKPSNVLVTPDDHAYLTDFGLARRDFDVTGLTDHAALVSAFDYAAPELIRGADVDARVDVYGLGLLLYEALAGRVPFPRRRDAAKLQAQVSATVPSLSVPRPDIPPELDQVVQTALAKDPAQRQESAAEFALQASEAVAATPPGWVAAADGRRGMITAKPLFTAPSDSDPERPRRRRRVWRPLALAALVVFLAAPAALVLALRDDGAGPRTEKVAERAHGVSAADGRIWIAAGREGLGALPNSFDDEPMRRVVRGRGVVRHVASGEGQVVAATPRELVFPPGEAQSRSTTVRIPGPLGALAVGAGAAWGTLADRGALLRVRRRRVTAVPLLGPASAITVGTRALWIADAARGTVFGVDPQTLEATTDKIPVGRRPIALTATRSAIWVVLAGGQLVRLDPDSGRPKGAPVPIPGQPTAVAADSREVWVTRRQDNAVTRIDARSARPRDEVGTATSPVGVTLTRRTAWVVGARGELTRIPR